MEKWDNCSFKVNEEYLEDRVCYGGLDLSSDPAGNIKTELSARLLTMMPTLQKARKYTTFQHLILFS